MIPVTASFNELILDGTERRSVSIGCICHGINGKQQASSERQDELNKPKSKPCVSNIGESFSQRLALKVLCKEVTETKVCEAAGASFHSHLSVCVFCIEFGSAGSSREKRREKRENRVR